MKLINIQLNQRELDIVRLSLLGLIEADRRKPFIHKHFNIDIEEVENLKDSFRKSGLEAQKHDDEEYR